MMPLAMALLSAAYPPELRARAGGPSGLTGLALLAGPVGGAIAQGLAWQWIFWLNVPIGLLLIPLVLTRIPRASGRTPPGHPRAGAGDGGAASVSWGLIRGNALGWNSPESSPRPGKAAGPLSPGRRAREPMLPLRFFRSRAFALGNTAGVFLYASLYGALFFLAQFLQTGLGYGPLDAGLRLLPWTGDPFRGGAARRRPRQPPR